MSDEPTPAQLEALADKLFSYSENVYAVVDSALNHEIHITIQGAKLEYYCLYEGEEAELLEEAAPYLVKIKQDDELTQWLFKNIYKKNAISFIQSGVDIEILADHLRQYAKIRTVMQGDDGNLIKQWAFFAFYDPRVFPRFIKGNTSKQSAEFFEEMDHFICENPENKNLLENYTFIEKDQKTDIQTINLNEISQQEQN